MDIWVQKRSRRTVPAPFLLICHWRRRRILWNNQHGSHSENKALTCNKDSACSDKVRWGSRKASGRVSARKGALPFHCRVLRLADHSRLLSLPGISRIFNFGWNWRTCTQLSLSNFGGLSLMELFGAKPFPVLWTEDFEWTSSCESWGIEPMTMEQGTVRVCSTWKDYCRLVFVVRPSTRSRASEASLVGNSRLLYSLWDPPIVLKPLVQNYSQSLKSYNLAVCQELGSHHDLENNINFRELLDYCILPKNDSGSFRSKCKPTSNSTAYETDRILHFPSFGGNDGIVIDSSCQSVEVPPGTSPRSIFVMTLTTFLTCSCPANVFALYVVIWTNRSAVWRVFDDKLITLEVISDKELEINRKYSLIAHINLLSWRESTLWYSNFASHTSRRSTAERDGMIRFCAGHGLVELKTFFSGIQNP